MKALVLTFDKYRPFAEHMIMCYNQVWPNNPFTFRVPYQSDEVKAYYEKKFGAKVEMIKSPSGIVDTMFALSDDLDESEWVYWCMDDRYPMQLNVVEVEKCRRYVEQHGDIDGLMFCNNPKSWMPENVFWMKYIIKTKEGQKYYRRKNYTMIWNHQFLRVKVVRTFFGLFPCVMKQAKEMDYIKDRAILPEEQHLFVLDHNIAIYGESTNRGVMLKNCAESFAEKGMPLPNGFEVSNKSVIKGTNGKMDNLKYICKETLRKLIKR